jgi:nucleoside-diphosphate-sugar epimerase
MSRMQVLITGAAGRLGRKLTRALEANHDLILGDIQPLDDARFVHLDITDMAAVRTAVGQCDAAVHAAIMDWPCCEPKEALRYAGPAIQVHVVGLHHMLHAAWEAGVGRFVYTSSLSVVDGIAPGVPVAPDTRHYSNAIYGLTKGFGEDLCRMFHQSFNLSVAVLRLGTVFIPEGDGAWQGNVHIPDLVAYRAPDPPPARVHVDDVTRAIELAIETTEPRYALVHLVGGDSGNQWDIQAARRIFGWQPQYAFGSNGVPHAT